MIKINLASKKKSNISGSADQMGDMFAALKKLDFSSLPDFREMFADVPFKKGVLPLLLVGVIYVVGQVVEENQLSTLAKELEVHRNEQILVKAELDKTKGYEAMKKSLDADELLLRTKVETIRKLIDGRQYPPKMMLALANSMPADVWLNEFKITEAGDISVKGSATGLIPVTDLLKNLSESTYFRDMQIGPAQQGNKELETGATIANFDLGGKKR